MSLEMYIFYSLASILLVLKYSRQQIGNNNVDWQWNIFIVSQLIKERSNNYFINELFVIFEITYLTFMITVFIISPTIAYDFIISDNYIFKILPPALILSMV